MALKMYDKDSDHEYETPPACTTVSRLVDVVDEGWREMKYPDEKKSWVEDRQVRLTYLTSEPMHDKRPFAVSEWVTINKRDGKGRTADGALFKKDGKTSKFVDRIEALLGAEIETLNLLQYEDEVELMEAMIGKGCLVKIGRKQNGREKVEKVMALPRGVAPAEGEYKRKKDRDRAEGRDPIEDMDERKRIAMLWAIADKRANEFGDPITKETILRNLYDEFEIEGGTHAAVRLHVPQIRLLVESIEGWEPPVMTEAVEDEIPF